MPNIEPLFLYWFGSIDGATAMSFLYCYIRLDVEDFPKLCTLLFQPSSNRVDQIIFLVGTMIVTWLSVHLGFPDSLLARGLPSQHFTHICVSLQFRECNMGINTRKRIILYLGLHLPDSLQNYLHNTTHSHHSPSLSKSLANITVF